MAKRKSMNVFEQLISNPKSPAVMICFVFGSKYETLASENKSHRQSLYLTEELLTLASWLVSMFDACTAVTSIVELLRSMCIQASLFPRVERDM